MSLHLKSGVWYLYKKKAYKSLLSFIMLKMKMALNIMMLVYKQPVLN